MQLEGTVQYLVLIALALNLIILTSSLFSWCGCIFLCAVLSEEWARKTSSNKHAKIDDECGKKKKDGKVLVKGMR